MTMSPDASTSTAMRVIFATNMLVKTLPYADIVVGTSWQTMQVIVHNTMQICHPKACRRGQREVLMARDRALGAHITTLMVKTYVVFIRILL